jgi:hypothetical protein
MVLICETRSHTPLELAMAEPVTKTQIAKIVLRDSGITVELTRPRGSANRNLQKLHTKRSRGSRPTIWVDIGNLIGNLRAALPEFIGLFGIHSDGVVENFGREDIADRFAFGHHFSVERIQQTCIV